MVVKRDAKGRFVKGTKPGPGRPRKIVLKLDDLTDLAEALWSYDLLRSMWFTFKVMNKYSQLGFLKCRKCGNDSMDRFAYKFDGTRIRARCERCGHWNDFQEKFAWYVEPLPPLMSPKDAGKVARQRRGTVEWDDFSQ